MSEKVVLCVVVEVQENVTMQTWTLISPDKKSISKRVKEQIYDDVGVDVDEL